MAILQRVERWTRPTLSSSRLILDFTELGLAQEEHSHEVDGFSNIIS